MTLAESPSTAGADPLHPANHTARQPATTLPANDLLLVLPIEILRSPLMNGWPIVSYIRVLLPVSSFTNPYQNSRT